MKTLSYFAASAAQVARHPVGVIKLEWKGATGLAAARFLQVHDAYAAPAEGAVPLKSWPIYTDAAGYKLFDVGELELVNGCYICISTTEATKTLASGSDDFSTLMVELSEAETPSGTTFAGDLTTGVESLEVWAESAGPKRLHEIIATNSLGSDAWVQIHAMDTPENASLLLSLPVANGATERFTFGKDGRDVRKLVDGDLKEGCTLIWSQEQNTLDAVTGGTLQAEYK